MRGWIVLLAFAAVGGLKWVAEHGGDVPPPPLVVAEELVALGGDPQEDAPAAPASQPVVAARTGPEAEEPPTPEPTLPAESVGSADSADSADSEWGGDGFDEGPDEAPMDNADLADTDSAPDPEQGDDEAPTQEVALTPEDRSILIRRLLDVYRRLGEEP